MKILKYSIFSVFIFTLISCSTTSEMGTGFNKFFQSKGYKQTIKDRDSLLSLTRQLQSDTVRLGSQIKSLQKQMKKMSGEYAFLKADYTALDSQHIALKKQYASLNDEQVKLKNEYRFYSDSLEKKLADMSTELNSRSQEPSPKSDELTTSADELKNKGKFQTMADERMTELEALISRQDSITKNLYGSLTKSLTGFSPDELSISRVDDKIHVSLNNKILFKPGAASIEAKGRNALKKLSQVLNKNPEIDIIVEGHTDNKPTQSTVYKDNWDLSVSRATTIVRILSEEYEVDPRKLTAAGRAEFVPMASNGSLEGRAKNKRIDIILSPIDEIHQEMGKNK